MHANSGVRLLGILFRVTLVRFTQGEGGGKGANTNFYQGLRLEEESCLLSSSIHKHSDADTEATPRNHERKGLNVAYTTTQKWAAAPPP